MPRGHGRTAVPATRLRVALLRRDGGWRRLESQRTSSASFKVYPALRPPDPPAVWQDSWGFGADLLTGQAGKAQNSLSEGQFSLNLLTWLI